MKYIYIYIYIFKNLKNNLSGSNKMAQMVFEMETIKGIEKFKAGIAD